LLFGQLDYNGKFLRVGDEDHGNAVDAVACVFGSELFAKKNVPEVSLAIAADNFGSASVRIRYSSNCVLDLIIKTWPAATAVELVG
jgi:hypothetical protein